MAGLGLRVAPDPENRTPRSTARVQTPCQRELSIVNLNSGQAEFEGIGLKCHFAAVKDNYCFSGYSRWLLGSLMPIFVANRNGLPVYH